MRYVLNHWKSYLQDFYNHKLYLATFIWVAILVAFNYYFDFEDDVIDSYHGSHLRIVFLFAYHVVSYIVTVWFISLFTDQNPFVNTRFWVITFVGFIILGYSRGHYYSYDLAKYLTDDYTSYRFVYKIIQRWMPLIMIVLPLILISKFWLKNSIPKYMGLSTESDIRPYLILLLLMAPLIYLATLDPSFLKQYPNYKRAFLSQFAENNDLNYAGLMTFYQLSYGFGFLVVELFFRGFLIFAFTRYLGPYVVLPMAVTYCVLHFGKPLGEAISSFFGGYLLGILAYRTRNIYGVVIIHIGIAWLMELFAYLQLNY